MTIGQDRAIARKMNKLRMFDIANSLMTAGRVAMEQSGDPPTIFERLETACDEWEMYIEETKRELGIDVG